MRVAVVGATGQAGTVIRNVLVERRFPVDEIRFMASGRSAGVPLDWKESQVLVEEAAAAPYDGIDLVLMAAGKGTARELGPRMAAEGAIVVDNSSAWRMDPEVPLVVPEVNESALQTIPKGIVANPNCTAMVAMPVLWPIHLRAGLKRVVVATYQAVSGGGLAGVRELEEQVQKTADLASSLTLSGSAIEYPPHSVFAEPIAHNVVPHAGSLVDDGSGETDEEKKFRDESRKILGIPALPLVCTCVRVPVFCGHSLAITLELDRPLGVDEATSILAAAPGVALADIPTPLRAAGGDVSLVGRIRTDTTVSNGLSLFIAGDNLRKGAALNAIQIAESLMRIGRLTA
jgi:aspartate-semialdehyde dehydrogenase